MFVLFSLALAEPPMMTSVEDAVAEAELIVVAEPVRVEFEALADGETLKGWSLKPFWMEYRVDEVLYGDFSPGQILRVHTGASGCEPYDFVVRREGNRFFERAEHREQDRELEAKHWLGEKPEANLLILNVGADGRVVNVGFGATPRPVSEAHLATVQALVKNKAKRDH